MAHILLVDDNVELAENIAEFLLDAGHSCSIFTHPVEALNNFEPGQYQAAIIDRKMPEIDGVELYRRLRAKDPALPALLITAYAGKEYLQEAEAEGIKEVVSKPVDLCSLVDIISRCIRDT